MNILFLPKNQIMCIGQQRIAQPDGPEKALHIPAPISELSRILCSLIVRQSNVYYISHYGDALRSHVKYQAKF